MPRERRVAIRRLRRGFLFPEGTARIGRVWRRSNLTETIDMVPGGIVLNIEKGRWHSLKSLESGTVLLEAKDGPYHPLEADEVMEG